jgi:hypothetical protein
MQGTALVSQFGGNSASDTKTEQKNASYTAKWKSRKRKYDEHADISFEVMRQGAVFLARPNSDVALLEVGKLVIAIVTETSCDHTLQNRHTGPIW